MSNVKNWMSWDMGIDLVALTRPGLQMPNVIVHAARMVHTPVGSAPAGLIFWQPDPAAPPAVMGFISTDINVGKYFGPNIFAGTPFEHAPVLHAAIAIEAGTDGGAATITVGAFRFESRLTGLGVPQLIHRPPATMSPFFQQGVEIAASRAELLVNGEKISLIIPPAGIGGGPAAVISSCGVYAR